MRYVLLLLLAGCTLFDPEPPKNTCNSNKDCFTAQGETCNPQTHVCEVHAGDAGVDAK